jgi:hypothetical protein
LDIGDGVRHGSDWGERANDKSMQPL